MEDRDGKKSFVIPKTHSSDKDTVVSIKIDSRDATELFDDIKSCALEVHFNFRLNQCKSCDTVRNQTLQKSYNERRIRMKKDHEPIERLGFCIVTYRDVAANIATNGIHCGQLSFTIDKYLGNPNDGIHLSRRPDVVLASSGAQGLYRFGLLVCKVLLANGYPTIPSTNNSQLSAQLNYDHHFCKVQTVNKEQRHIDDLLADSLIFCYEHENMEVVSRPSQILPIAILWYDLTEKFPPELVSIHSTKTVFSQESLRRHENPKNKKPSVKETKSNQLVPLMSIKTSANSISSTMTNSPSRGDSSQRSTTSGSIAYSITRKNLPSLLTSYQNHMLTPIQCLYLYPPIELPARTEEKQQEQQHQIVNSRDPRLLRTKREQVPAPSETIPLSSQNTGGEPLTPTTESPKSSSKTSTEESLLLTKGSSSVNIPLHSSIRLVDPRLKTQKNTRTIFYLEMHSVKRVIQLQKRLNHYYDSKPGSIPKTIYTVIPFLMRDVLDEEYQRLLTDDSDINRLKKSSDKTYCSSLCVSVLDCLRFGFTETKINNLSYIDLEQFDNRFAYDHIEMSNQLIEREKQLNSQQIRLHLREKRQRKLQQMINRQSQSDKLSYISKSSLPNSKLCITNGRKLLKENQMLDNLANMQLPQTTLDFLSREYKNERRSYVKRILAELVGILIEKYPIENNRILSNDGEDNQNPSNNSILESTVEDIMMNSVTDMDIDSPSSQALCDHDERFRAATPPTLALSSANESIDTPSPTPLVFNQKPTDELSNETSSQLSLDNSSTLQTITKPQSMLMTSENEASSNTSLEQCQMSSDEQNLKNNNDDDSACLNSYAQGDEKIDQPLNENLATNLHDDTNRSLNEFVRILRKEVSVSKSPSPNKIQHISKRSYDYHRESNSHTRRLSPVSDENDEKEKISFSNSMTQDSKSPTRRLSSNRIVTLVSQISDDNYEKQIKTKSSDDHESNSTDEPVMKRMRTSSSSSSVNKNIQTTDIDERTISTETNLRSVVTARKETDDGERQRTPSDKSIDKSSQSKSTDHHRHHHHHRIYQEHERKSSTNSPSTPIKSLQIPSYSRDNLYSPGISPRSSRGSSIDKYDRSEKKISPEDYRPKRRRSPDNTSLHNYPNYLSDRHDKFQDASYRSSLSSMYRPHDLNDLLLSDDKYYNQQRQPVRHRRYNYNHQSVTDHPHFVLSNTASSSSSASLSDYNYTKSSNHHLSISPVSFDDRRTGSPYYPSESRTKTHSNSFEPKRSSTIERLQNYLDYRRSESSAQQLNSSRDDKIRYPPSLLQSSDSSAWPSSSYSSKAKSDKATEHDKRSFTYHDSERLLNLVQRYRN